MNNIDKTLVSFAEMVMNHPGKDKVLDRVDSRLLRKFRGGTPEIREEVVRMMDSTDMFFKELQVIIDESVYINEEPENG